MELLEHMLDTFSSKRRELSSSIVSSSPLSACSDDDLSGSKDTASSCPLSALPASSARGLAAAFYRLSLPLSAQVTTERSQQLIISLLLLCYSLLKCPGLGYTLLSHFLTVPVVCLVSIT